MTSGWDASLIGPDPVPGDFSWTAAQSSLLAHIRDDAGDARRTLDGVERQLPHAAWKGKAADRFRETLNTTVLQDLGKLHDSYGTASSAMSTFSSQVRQLQNQASGLMSQARTAKADLDRAESDGNGASSALVGAELRVAACDTEIVVARAEAMAVALMNPGVTAPLDLVVNHGSAMVSRAIPSIHLLLQPLGVDNSILDRISNLVYSLGHSADRRSTHRSEVDTHRSALQDAQRREGAARDKLESLRRQADALHHQFLGDAKSAKTKLEHAAQQGLHNLTFMQRALHDLGQWTSDVLHWPVDVVQWQLDVIRAEQRAITDAWKIANGDMSGLSDLGNMAGEIGKGALDLTNHCMRVVKDLAPIVTALAFVPCLAPVLGPVAAVMGLAIMVDDALPVVQDLGEIAAGHQMPVSKLGMDMLNLGIDGAGYLVPEVKSIKPLLGKLAVGTENVVGGYVVTAIEKEVPTIYAEAKVVVPQIYEDNRAVIDEVIRGAAAAVPGTGVLKLVGNELAE